MTPDEQQLMETWVNFVVEAMQSEDPRGALAPAVQIALLGLTKWAEFFGQCVAAEEAVGKASRATSRIALAVKRFHDELEELEQQYWGEFMREYAEFDREIAEVDGRAAKKRELEEFRELYVARLAAAKRAVAQKSEMTERLHASGEEESEQ